MDERLKLLLNITDTLCVSCGADSLYDDPSNGKLYCGACYHDGRRADIYKKLVLKKEKIKGLERRVQQAEFDRDESWKRCQELEEFIDSKDLLKEFFERDKE